MSRPRIGYYVHHVGAGHVVRAGQLSDALRTHLDAEVTGLSSLPRPASWGGGWLRLAADEEPSPSHGDVDAGGRLHWVPRHHPGLLARSAGLSRWLAETEPDLMVVDVSVEVTLLARLHGVPVVGVVVPGDRTDPAHVLGQDVSAELVGFWPPGATTAVVRSPARDRIHALGALSRWSAQSPQAVAAGATRHRSPRVAVLNGRGGPALDVAGLEAEAAAAGWEVDVLGGSHGWVDDPFRVLAAADAVVTQCGQNALADVAASRTPAVVCPAQRPHDEQEMVAAALDAGPWPAVRRAADDTRPWLPLLQHAATLDGAGWSTWCERTAADRFASLVAGLVHGRRAA